jgi:bacteriocin-like protein
MSKENVKLMFDKIENDDNLKKKYIELMHAHKKETVKILFDKLIEFGMTSGFAFSKDDLLTARAECKELSDNQLDNVSGGCYNTGTITGSIR